MRPNANSVLDRRIKLGENLFSSKLDNSSHIRL